MSSLATSLSLSNLVDILNCFVLDVGKKYKSRNLEKNNDEKDGDSCKYLFRGLSVVLLLLVCMTPIVVYTYLVFIGQTGYYLTG